MANAEFKIQVMVEVVVARLEPEHKSLVPVWLKGIRVQCCYNVGA